MKLNINKEMLLKNRFWVILGVSVCLTLTGLLYLQLNVDAENYVKDLQKAAQTAKSARGVENQATIQAKEAQALKASKSESAVWSAAWLAQEPLVKWSDPMEDTYHFYDGLFATNIVLDKMPAKVGEWADNERLMNGRLVSTDPDWIVIKDKDNVDRKFYRTSSVDKVTLADAKAELEFGKLDGQVGKLAAVTYQKGRYFGEVLTVRERAVFKDSYKAQVHQILRSVDPLDEEDKGVVQLRNWRYKPGELPDEKSTFFRFVSVDWDMANDFSKEAWVAQENLWIQKEIYRIIRASNDAVSKFKGTGGDGVNKTFVFTNSNFELQLSLKGDNSLSFAIKNKLPKKQKLDLNFRVMMQKGAGFTPELIRISAPALAATGDPAGKDLYTHTEPPAKESRRTGVYSVEQVLSWDSAAVKRIDHISIGSNDPVDISQSHRTFVEPLVPHEAPAPPKPGEAVIPQPGAPPFGGERKPGGAVGGNTGMFEPGHGLWRDRYLEVSEQSRRVPVGVVLIVAQSQVDRILTNFNNSNMRFLLTQVLLNHYTGSLQPPPLPEKADPANPNPLTFPFGGIGRPPFGGMPPPPMGGVPGAGGSSGSEGNMELVIYGIVTLYERYPPRPAGPRPQ